MMMVVTMMAVALHLFTKYRVDPRDVKRKTANQTG